ncbi:acetate--CoA ligase family protein [Candidatus Micrarchaeota archaeon]|nr:acetate--CoA ligase family protein [Candidatus Micrarchaeota archaeon]
MELLEGIATLKKYGINVVPTLLTRDLGEAKKIGTKLGFPLAIKIISPDILHKSDRGCVKLNISNVEELGKAWKGIMANAKGARIEGMLIQKMASKGIELIVGGKVDEQFGPLVLFGLGGIYVEILKDFSMRVCPISKEDALEMISEIKGLPILQGARGTKPVDLNAVADLLVKVSRLLSESKIKELDLNPVIAYEKGYVVVDVRMIE